MFIRCAAIDPSMRNFGLVKVTVDIETFAIKIVDMKLVSTEKKTDKKKTVRQNSDDLRRAEELTVEVHQFISDCRIVFGEIPTGGQSARAAFGFGLSIGILAGLKIAKKPLIQLQPSEVKKAAVGTTTASKEEMIEWATELYPNADWRRARGNPNGKFTADNEHLADATAVAHAGVKSDEFQRIAAMIMASQAA